MNNSLTVTAILDHKMSQNLNCFFTFLSLFTHLVWSVWFHFPGLHSGCKHAHRSFTHSKYIVLLTGGVGFRGWHSYFFIHSPHFSTFFPSTLSVWHFVQWGVMKGDNASWVEEIDFSFLLSRSLYSLPHGCFNVLSFFHFYLFFFYSISLVFIFDPSLSLSTFFACTPLSLYSTFCFMYPTLHPPFIQHFALCTPHSTHTCYLFFLVVS